MSHYQDTRSALLAYLKTVSDVTAVVGTRVWGDEIPRDEIEQMPQMAVVFNATSDPPPLWATRGLPLEVQAYDVYCYGVTLAEADLVRRTIHNALNEIRRELQDAVLIHWARLIGGGGVGRDDETDWPVSAESWEVRSDTRQASPNIPPLAGVFSVEFSVDFS